MAESATTCWASTIACRRVCRDSNSYEAKIEAAAADQKACGQQIGIRCKGSYDSQRTCLDGARQPAGQQVSLAADHAWDYHRVGHAGRGPIARQCCAKPGL